MKVRFAAVTIRMGCMQRFAFRMVAFGAVACGSDPAVGVFGSSAPSGSSVSSASAGTGGAAMVCSPGRSLACACVNGAMGAQSCLADGSGYAACECGGGAAGTGGAAASSAISSSSSASESSAATGGASASSSSSTGAGGAGGGNPTSNCSDASRLVYVIADDNSLYSFAPDKLSFEKIGVVNCKTLGNVNSMAIDRLGMAWVNYDTGELFKVSTKDASCEATTFAPNQAGFAATLGMAFSSDSPGSNDETLFVSDNALQAPNPGPGKGLGKIDLSTMTLTPNGPYTAAAKGSDAELTGSGNAQLYGWFTTTPSALGAINKADGSTPNTTPLPASLNVPDGGFAFSLWGGDFWFFTSYSSNGADVSSSVTHYVTATKSATVVLNQIGFVVVAAGVSTCAPVKPPV
jgi:hypothetical protein